MGMVMHIGLPGCQATQNCCATFPDFLKGRSSGSKKLASSWCVFILWLRIRVKDLTAQHLGLQSLHHPMRPAHLPLDPRLEVDFMWRKDAWTKLRACFLPFIAEAYQAAA